MTRILKHLLLAGTLGFSALATSAPVKSIWPAGTLGLDPSIPEESHKGNVTTVKNIHNPNLTIYRPEKPNGVALIVCPGGGYHWLASGHEGHQVAKRFNQDGITTFVLKYRLPTTQGAEFKHPVPVSDALRAIQWVRHHAKDFSINPNKVGILGFSAGGHLVASASTLYDRVNIGNDAISKENNRPDFAVLGYPVISTRKDIAHGCVTHPLAKGASAEEKSLMSMENNVTSKTPPTFLFHAKNDRGVVPANSEVMHAALQEHGVPSELRLYEKGGHGFGLGRGNDDSKQWPEHFTQWLRAQNILPAATSGQHQFFTPEKDKSGITASSEGNASLPNVLILGDSISIGYTKPLIAELKGIANVQRAKANCGDTVRGKKSLKRWLGDTQWDVIHFNWGLHDLCYRDPKSKVQGNRDKINGVQSVPLAQYKANLGFLVQELKATGATLIWASTSVVPEGEAGRVLGDEIKYNRAAAEVMLEHGVIINDLHQLSSSFNGKYSPPGDVHYSKEGSTKLAQQVAHYIRPLLKKSTP